MTLGQIAVHSLKWRYGGTAFRVGLQFMIGVMLVRLLSPAVFGLIGMALIVIGFGKLVGEVGFGVALIQRAHLTQQHIRAAVTGSVIIGMLLFLILWLAAPTISAIFRQEALTPILRITGVSFIPSGLSTALASLLRRELQFRTLAIVETASYAVGFGVAGVPLALCGYGAWSLVAANIVQPVSLTALILHARRPPISPYFHPQEYGDLLRVGSPEVLNNATNYVAENLDFFVIGKWLGASTLGLYNRCFYVTTLPVSQFSAGLSSVIFPVFAKLQGDLPRLGRAYLQTVSLTTLITMPALFAMAAAPTAVIAGLFGDQWRAAAGAFRILCLSGSLWAILCICGALSHARGYVFSECWRQLIYLGVMSLMIWLLIPRGIEGVAGAVLFATFVRYLLLAELSVKLARLRWRDFFLAQVPGCLLATIVFVTAYLVHNLAARSEISDVVELGIIVATSVLSVVASLLLLPPSWFGDLYPCLNEHVGLSLPSWLQSIIAVKVRRNRLPDRLF